MRALDLAAADVVADDLVAEAVEAEATVISESSVVEQVPDMAVDSEVPQHQLMVEDSVDHLPKLPIAELHPMAVDMVVEDTETHQEVAVAAAANPGGRLFHNNTSSHSGPLSTLVHFMDLGQGVERFSTVDSTHLLLTFRNSWVRQFASRVLLSCDTFLFSGGATFTTKVGCCLLQRLAPDRVSDHRTAYDR